MSWRDLVSEATTVTLPWLGGAEVHGRERSWTVVESPPELGWHRFEVAGSRRAVWRGAGEPDAEFEVGRRTVSGYLLGDRLVPDDASATGPVEAALAQTRRVFLVEPGLPRFARAVAAETRDGALVFVHQAFPLGPEQAVLEAYQDRAPSVVHVAEVTPALDLAFRWLTHQRARAEARRARIAAERAAEEAARRRVEAEAEARRVHHEFGVVAAAALGISGAELLDWRAAHDPRERVVQFRFRRRRFECVVDARTLRVVDSGICLTDEETGERGDTYFTLESLPGVVAEAMERDALHVYRHVD